MRMPLLSLAVRNLTRRPGFAAAAIVLLALGAGANAAVYSVVRGVLLRPLPFPESDRLVAVWPGEFVSNQDYGYWQDHLRSFDGIATLAPGWMMGLVAEGGDPIKVTGAKVSDNLFRVLGAAPTLGRAIEPGDAVPGRDRVAVLSDELWRRRFGADPAAVGRTILIDEVEVTVIGVMPPGFEVFEPGTDLWVPMPWEPGGPGFTTTFEQALGRLRPGVTIKGATAEMQQLAPVMRRELGKPNDWGQAMRVDSLQQVITGDVRPALLILLGAVGLMLLLAAGNLGTLVLGRSVERMSEMAVRTALGASRAALVRQIVVEQAVLAIAGSVAGALVAWVALPALVAWIPPEVPGVGRIALDWTVLATVLAASVAVSVLVALVPAAMATRPNIQVLLRQARGNDSPARARTLGALVAMQIALAAVLGIGAALMLRSIWNLQQVDPGFQPNGVLTFRLQTTSKYRTLTQGRPYMQRVVDRVRALPGVESVGAIAHLPLSDYAWTTTVRRADHTLVPGESAPVVGWRFIDWDYFKTMEIPLRMGRTFTASDTIQNAAVGIVNETLARQFFGTPEAALGQPFVQLQGGRPGETPLTIVGIVGDVRHLGLDEPPAPELFRPMAQTFMFPMAFVVRTAGPPAQLGAAIRAAAFEIDPVVPVAELQPYPQLIEAQLGRPRLLGYLLSLFAGAGLVLGLVGVYGVAAYRVRQREREIGIRLALGADPAGVARGVVAQGLSFAAMGLGIGLPAAWVLSRLMASVIYGVTPHDPLSFVGLPLAVAAVTAAACYVPARRAARIDPVRTLRQG